ncbi:hypothetical protein [Segatella salivae]|jgi:hypothetical protein|uniref:tellurite resistance TerB family protein n=1 Tax=Segatella salivae TaxID=228604 RepID=UPI0028E4E3FB|nr:hypothetical protein [Segatella salivae]
MNKKIDFSNFITEESAESLVISKELQELSIMQKKAIIKAVLYVISADGIITNEEKNFFAQLLKGLSANNELLKEAADLEDEEMFKVLQSVNKEDFLISLLNQAAMVDNNLALEEEKFIATILEYIPQGKKPRDFYNKILTF